jgi:hypothetical protein
MPVNGTPPGCAQVQSAWDGGGYWTTNAKTDLLPPAGGIYGAAGIVDVAQGTLFAFGATAIDGFSDVIQHTGPGDSRPNLGTAVTDSALGIATAYVPIGSAMIKSDYQASTRGVDAVSAVLMADTLYNEFEVEPAVGASTDWLITFPTKQFYVDPAIVGTALDSYLSPFQEVFGGGLQNGHPDDPGLGCFHVGMQDVFDREGIRYVSGSDIVIGPPTITGGNYMCYESQALTFGHARDGSQAFVSGVLQSRLNGGTLSVLDARLPVDSGHVSLSFVHDYYNGKDQMFEQHLRPSIDGDSFVGLPAIGFLAVNYINANVTPGVLSNYSGTYPHRSSASCTNSTNPQGVCQ